MQQPLTGTPRWLQSIPMRTQGEIEAAFSERVSRFEQDHTGLGPNSTYLLIS
jgi:hypothetical protein